MYGLARETETEMDYDEAKRERRELLYPTTKTKPRKLIVYGDVVSLLRGGE